MNINNLDQIKEELIAEIDRLQPELLDLSRYIFENPELAFKEVKASKLLTDKLTEKGFETVLGLGSLPTAFSAEYQLAEGGPVICIVAEYDALPELGHACGHNLIATAAYGSAVALKNVLKDKGIPGKIKVMGTPAEEDGGGKIILIREGFFQDADICMMIHPTSGTTRIAGECLSSHEMKISWHGKTAHAESHPEDGVNALDALHIYYTAIACMRQQLPQDVRIAQIVLEGGKGVALIPDHCVISVDIVSEDRHLEDVKHRVRCCAKGAAMASGCEVKIEEIEGYLGRKNNHTLEKVFRENFALLNEPLMEGMPTDFGTTDFGNVMRIVPSCNPYVSIFTERKISNHTEFFRDKVISKRGEEALLIGAKAMAISSAELIFSPKIIAAAKEELNRSMGL